MQPVNELARATLKMDLVNTIDYLIFAISLLLSAIISFYFGYFKTNNNSYEESMFAGGNMPLVPICLSVIASTMSSIAYIGLPRETYYYGTILIYAAVGELTAVLVLYFFYIPVFYQHKFKSIFEYVERRFGKAVRSLASAVYTLTQIFYSLITMYSSCSAVSQVTAIPFNIFAPATCILCTLYSTIGGLRGVVWADVLQAIYMFVSILALVIAGFDNMSSEESGIEILKRGGRWNHFDFDLSPLPRYTIISTYLSAVGLGLFNTCTNQGNMQRYMSLASLKKARLVIVCAGVSTSLFLVMTVVLGIAIYLTYHNCDPILNKDLSDSNHFMIYYAMETGKTVPGLAGLVLTGIMSAALSSMSTMINSISGNTYEDIIKPMLPWRLTSAQTNYCVKGITLVFGLVISGGIFALDATGGIYQVFRTLTSLTGGLIVFIFGFGLLFRNANTKGVMAGSVAGLVVTFWLGVGVQDAISKGNIIYPTKVVTNEGCHINSTENVNVTTVGYLERVPVIFDENLAYPFRISYNFLIFISLVTSFVIGTVTSLVTQNKTVIDEALLVPQLRRTAVTPNKYFIENKEDNVELMELNSTAGEHT